jgi:hypothetical protein
MSFFAVTFLTLGCAGQEEQAREGQARVKGKIGMVSKAQAIKAAELYLKAEGGLGRYDVDANADENGRWRVLFNFLPAIPGGHTMVIVDKNGSIIEVVPGN